MKLHVRSVEHLEEVIDRFTPYGQTTTSIIQSSPVARRGLELGLTRSAPPSSSIARPLARQPTTRRSRALVAGLGEHGPRPAEHDAADQPDEQPRITRSSSSIASATTLNSSSARKTTTIDARRSPARSRRRCRGRRRRGRRGTVGHVAHVRARPDAPAAAGTSGGRASTCARRGAVTLRRNMACQGKRSPCARAARSRSTSAASSGPFGGGVVAVLVPQLRDAFDATTAGVAASIPAYLVPFAVLQLVSGTIGERLGRRRVVRTGYIAYALLSRRRGVRAEPRRRSSSSARCRARANAFLTPLLLAGLADRGPAAPDRARGRDVRGRADRGGRARAAGRRRARRDRLAARVPRARRWSPPASRCCRRRRASGATTCRGCAPCSRAASGCSARAAFTGYAGVTGVGFLVAVLAADEFGLGSVARGVLLAGFGVAGMLFGRAAGDAVDRFGRVPVALVGVAVCAALVAALGFAPTRGRARRAVVRDRARLRARVGGHQRARGRGRARQPRGRDVGRLGLQVRGQRGRAADVAAALPRRSAARLPRRRRCSPRSTGALHPPAARGTLETCRSRPSATRSPPSSTRSGRSSRTWPAVQWPALFLALVLLHGLPHAAGAGVVSHPACRLSRHRDRVQAHLGRVLRGLRLQRRRSRRAAAT